MTEQKPRGEVLLGIAQLSFESLVGSETLCTGPSPRILVMVHDVKRQHVMYIECRASFVPPCIIGLLFVGMSFVSMEAE